jgi:hypothetical protein
MTAPVYCLVQKSRLVANSICRNVPATATSFVNEFVNETHRNYPDGMERRVMGGTGD